MCCGRIECCSGIAAVQWCTTQCPCFTPRGCRLQPGASGAGSEESAASAAEGTPVGDVETSVGSGWQLAAPSVGDGTTETNDGQPAADGVIAAAAPDADSGAGSEESGSKAAEETPAGNVEETSRKVDWQLGTPSVGGDDDAATGAPQKGEAAEDGGAAVEAEPGADIGGGAEEAAQV